MQACLVHAVLADGATAGLGSCIRNGLSGNMPAMPNTRDTESSDPRPQPQPQPGQPQPGQPGQPGQPDQPRPEQNDAANAEEARRKDAGQGQGREQGEQRSK